MPSRRTTYQDLQPGERFHLAMKWWTVLEVGEVIPNDGRVPIKTTGPRGVKTWTIKADAPVNAFTPRREDS
jgi:hypothetical protein